MHTRIHVDAYVNNLRLGQRRCLAFMLKKKCTCECVYECVCSDAKFQPCTVFNNPSSNILQTCTYLPRSAATQCCTVTITLCFELLGSLLMQEAAAAAASRGIA